MGQRLERIGRGLYRRYGLDGKSFSYFGIYAAADGRMKRVTLKGAQTRKDAEAMLRKLRQAVDDIKVKGYQPRLDPDLTLGDIIENYLSYARDHLDQGERLGTNARALLEFFGRDCKAISVSKSSVESFVKWRREKPREHKAEDIKTGKLIEVKVQPATINRELSLLGTAYARAIANELLERNPVELVKALIEDNERKYVITDEEYQRLLSFLPDHHGAKLKVEIAWSVGMRLGEIEGLRWSQVDFEAGFINLTGRDCKNKHGRKVPLSDYLLGRLRALKAERISAKVVSLDDAVFPIKTRRTFERARKLAGLVHPVYGRFKFHDLRHCAATRMLDEGRSWRDVRAITGHKTDSMLRRYDNGPSDAALLAAVGRTTTPNLYKTCTMDISGEEKRRSFEA